MTVQTIHTGAAVWTDSAKPSMPHSGATTMTVSSTTHGLVWVNPQIPAGATVTAATLTLTQLAGVPSAPTLAIQPLAGPYKVSTVTYNNEPGVTGTSTSLTKTNPPVGTAWAFDVTAWAQSIASGGRNYGLKLTGNNSVAIVFGGWRTAVLTVTYTTAPAKPVLYPAGVVALAAPSVWAAFTDPDGLALLQVQVDPAANGTTPAFDSGQVAPATPNTALLDLSKTTFVALASGASTQARMRVQDGSGQWSDWSDWVTFTYTPFLAASITSPATGSTVSDTTPPLIATYAGTATGWRWLVYVDGNLRADSGRLPGASGSTWTPPAGVITGTGHNYSATVMVWDNTAGRVAVPNAPVYASASSTFTYAYDATIAAVSYVAVDLDRLWPVPILNFQGSPAPDAYAVERTIDSGSPVILTDTIAAAATSWLDYTAPPMRSLTYRVLEVRNGKTGSAGPSVTTKMPAAAVCLLQPDTDKRIDIAGDLSGLTMNFVEDAVTLTPQGSPDVRLIEGLRGPSGTWAGQIITSPAAQAYNLPTVHDKAALLWWAKSNPSTVWRLVTGAYNFPVTLGDIALPPLPKLAEASFSATFSFSWADIGEPLPYALAGS